VLQGSARPAGAFFDDLAPSPQARALGEAMTARAGDPWAFYYNPAALPWIVGPSVEFASVHPNGFGFERLTAAVFAAPLPRHLGCVSVGWRNFGVDYKGVSLETENTLSLAHGIRVLRRSQASVSVGWTLDLYDAEFAKSAGASGDGSDGVDPGSAWSAGLGVGGLVTLCDRARLGVFSRNLNQPTIGVDHEPIFRQVSAGVACAVLPHLDAAFDVRGRGGEDLRVCGGLQFDVVEMLQFRTGFETSPERFTAGFGVRLPVLFLDYGFSSGSDLLDGSHHFGLGLRFGPAAPATP
jgi:hypothetical protein